MVVQAPTAPFPARPAGAAATRPARPGLLGALAALFERMTAPEAQASADERYWQSVARGF
jgi:hypothetical protein